MKFGIFYELQLPKPWADDDEYELLNNALDQIELADRLGYDYAWEVEHHFLEEYSHSSAPEVFLAAASQRTKNIRLGHGIVQLPTNHPARVAERVSTLDLISHGRVELGVGEGSQRHRAAPVRPPLPRQAGRVGGRHALPDAHVLGGGLGVPRRVLRLPAAQRRAQAAPEAAPAAVGGVQPARHDRDGRRAGPRRARLPVRVGAEAATAWVQRLLQRLHQAARAAGPYATNPNIAVVSQFMCAETDEEAQGQGRRQHVLPVRARLLQHPRSGRARHGQPVGRVPGVEGDAEGPEGPARRPDRQRPTPSARSCSGSRRRTSTR